MTKALLGAQLSATELALLDEVHRLRARIAALEAELATRTAVADPGHDGHDGVHRGAVVVPPAG